jgi:tetratricopeptide (TPR) repeat protein
MLRLARRGGLKWRGRGSLSTSPAVDKELGAFQEWVDAKTDLANGQFKRALPGLLRVHSVVAKALGPCSPVTVQVAFRTAQLFQHMGDFGKATQQLNGVLEEGKAREEDLAVALQASSLMHLLSGSASEALSKANEALRLCESSSTTPTSLFSPSHGLIGLCQFHLGRFDEAEVHLQLAARWAETPLSQIEALNNLGYFFWVCGKDQDQDREKRVVRRDRRLQSIRSKSLWHKEGEDKEGEDKEGEAYLAWSKRGAEEALLYWDDALAVAAATKSSSSSSGAGCAPSSPSSPLGPGMSASIVGGKAAPAPTAPAAAAATTSTSTGTGTGTEEAALHECLSDSRFAAAYATVLCNRAEAHFELGLGLAGSTAKSSDDLSSALKALERHGGDLSCQPVLGRVLCAVAYANLAASMAVTAEGLFRSALDKLEGPFGASDPRFRLERVLAMGGYSILLSKWERREADGAALLAKAVAVFEALPRFRYESGTDEGGESLYDAKLLPLTPALRYPSL